MPSIHNLGTNCGEKIWMKHMMHSSEKGDKDKRNRQWPDIVSDKQNSYLLRGHCLMCTCLISFLICCVLFDIFWNLCLVLFVDGYVYNNHMNYETRRFDIYWKW